MSPILSIQNLSKTYNQNHDCVHALSNINLEIKEGEILAIFGESGSGKTTLLNLIGGLDKASSGNIYFNDENIEKWSDKKLSNYRNKQIGFIFQDFLLIPHLTVEENIKLPLKFQKEKNNSYEEIIEQIGLKNREKYLPENISGGEKQRTAIGRTLINNPKIILADEPTGNLDQKTGKIILDILKNIQKERNITIIISTHDENVSQIANRTIYLEKGKIKE